MAEPGIAPRFDELAADVPGQLALVGRSRRVSWSDFVARSARLGWYLERELGVAAGSTVAVHLRNRTEYLEVVSASIRLGATPVGVAVRGDASEVHHIIDVTDAKVLVHAPEDAETAAAAARRIPRRWRPALLATDDHYEQAIASGPPLDDLPAPLVDATLGIVGYRRDRAPVVTRLRGRDLAAAWSRANVATTVLPLAPLTSRPGLLLALATLLRGGTLVLLDGRRIDPREVWDAVEREHVEHLGVVGDVFANPLIDALRATPGAWDLTSVRRISAGGATLSEAAVEALGALVHGATIDAGGPSPRPGRDPEPALKVVRKHASVSAAAVVAIPTDDGEQLVALAEVREHHFLDHVELAAWCNRQLTVSTAPDRYFVLERPVGLASADAESLGLLARDLLEQS
jgi:3-oxocholest-4-en-26-oate---CoA ligase